MSLRAAAWARQQTTGSPGAKLVLIALADYADDDGVCWPSQATLSALCEMGERSVRRHLSDLENRGLITRSRRAGADGYRTSDTVQLNLTYRPNRPVIGETNRPDLPLGQPDNLAARPETYRPDLPVIGENLPDNLAGNDAAYRPNSTVLPAKFDSLTGQSGRVTVREPSITNKGYVQTEPHEDEPPVDNSPPSPDPNRCPDHQHHPSPPPCRHCANRREAHTRLQAETQARAIREARAEREAERLAAIRACDQCGPDGKRGGSHHGTVGIRCNHVKPGGRARAEHALAAAQQAS